jgi:hypothetical protein
MLVGVTDKKGADMTVSVTPTVKEPNPILKMTDAVYVPAARCAFRFEAVMVTLAVAPAFKVLLVGLVKSQFAPLLVCAVADQVPGELQFVIVTACVGGSFTLAVPVNLSAFGVP